MFIPMSLAMEGNDVKVKKIALKDEMSKRMRELGLMAGNSIKIVKNDGKSLIIAINDSRFGIDMNLARKIFIEEVS
ncbi:FeoA family protein [Clostridium sp.]|uniref:FeoA family protein n=1 Tax=Clostridium sp. TaxID=1506 RepID=UPI0039963BDA